MKAFKFVLVFIIWFVCSAKYTKGDKDITFSGTVGIIKFFTAFGLGTLLILL